MAERFLVTPMAPDLLDKFGVADNVKTGLLPLNGLRHRPAGGTSGWYIWAGEQLPAEEDFFQPVHHQHLCVWCPSAEPYLALPPGWRFLVAPDVDDVWFDEALLDAS